MKIRVISATGASRLALIFAGWGVDDRMFASLRFRGMDVAVVWDYRDDSIDMGLIGGYESVEVYAWSFGVFMGARLLARHRLPVTRSVAINGTLHPIDDDKGITVAIFQGTLNGLNERSLMKFYRRMCGGTERFARFKESMPHRGVDELRQELMRVAEVSGDSCLFTGWDEAVVAVDDAIFPQENMCMAWNGIAPVVKVEGGHLPDWSRLFLRLHVGCRVDKKRMAERFARSHSTYNDNAVVQQKMARELWRLWQANAGPSRDSRIVEVGAGTGLFTRQYLPSVDSRHVELWDMAPIEVDGCRVVECDAEVEIANRMDDMDFIVSSATFQWFDDPAGFLRNAHRALRRDGVMAFSTFGPDNLHQIAHLTQRSLDYLSVKELRTLASERFDVLVAEESHETLRFGNAMELLRHLKLTGVNSLGGCNAIGQARRIISCFDGDGSVELTYHPIYMILKRKDI